MKFVYQIACFSMLLFSCSPSEYCGKTVSKKEAKHSVGNALEGPGMNIGLNLSFATAKQFPESKDLKFEVEFSNRDSVVLNILNIHQESVAKEISCFIKEEGFSNNLRSFVVGFKFPNQTTYIQLSK